MKFEGPSFVTGDDFGFVLKLICDSAATTIGITPLDAALGTLETVQNIALVPVTTKYFEYSTILTESPTNLGLIVDTTDCYIG